MNKRLSTLLFILFMGISAVMAQRFTDMLDRGLVAVPQATGNLLTWRKHPSEYYDVKYNVYRNGTKVTTVSKTNYQDNNGNASSQYQIAPVVNGEELEKCNIVKPWTSYVYRLGNNRYTTVMVLTLPSTTNPTTPRWPTLTVTDS